jgi:hypothetical protein
LDARCSNFFVGVLLVNPCNSSRNIRPDLQTLVASHFGGIFGAFRRNSFLPLCRYDAG